MPLYIVDSSIWIAARRRRGSYLPALLSERIEADQVATCAPVALEVLVGPPTGETLEREWHAVWSSLRWIPAGNDQLERAVELLRSLAGTTAGAHRRRPIDFLIAAIAEAEQQFRPDVVLWHWDSDLTVICDHAGIAHEAEHFRARANGIG